MAIKAFIFDFDLTLADSTQGIFLCVNYALQHLGYPAVDIETIKKLIGYSLPETFRLLTKSNNKEHAARFTSLFVEHANEVMNSNTVLFNETFELMPKIKAKGYLTAIVSTKFRYRIEGILKRDNALQFFDYIIGGEDVKEHKPHPEGLILALEKLNLKKSEVIFVGDTIIDAETAQKAEVEFIGVLSGTTTYNDFQKVHNGLIINNLREIEALLVSGKLQ